MLVGPLQDNVVAIITSWFFGFIGVLANCFVIGKSIYAYNTKLKYQRVNRVHTLLIINLAIADLCGALYLVMIASGDRYYAQHYDHIYQCIFRNDCYNETNIWLLSPGCSIARFFAILGSYIPACIMLFISIDRYTCVVSLNGQNRLSINKIKISIIISWIIGLGIAAASITRSLQLFEPSNFRIFTNVCFFSNLYDNVFQVLAICGFIIIIVVYLITMGLYISIIIHIRRARNLVASFSKSSINNRTKIETRLSIITGFLAVTNLLSWLPSLLLFITQTANVPFIKSYLGYHISVVGYLLLYVNCCANPVTYSILTSQTLRQRCSCFNCF